MGDRVVCRHGKKTGSVCEGCKEDGRIWREEIADRVVGHIDTMYPAMWDAVPKSARRSIRNTILNALSGLV